MRIQDVKVIHVRLPLKSNYKSWTGDHITQDSIITVISTDSGVAGISSIEPDRPNYSEQSWYEILYTINEDIKNLLIGEDPFDIPEIIMKIDKSIYGRFMSKAAIDIALNDLKAKVLGIPLNSLFGGGKDMVELIGWIGLLNSQETVAEAIKYIEKGFKTLKVKIGNNIREEVKRIRELRDSIGYDVKIRVDANQALSSKSAIRLARELSKYEIELFEQPVSRDDIEGMAFVNKNSDIPIMADESVVTPRDLLRVAEAQAASIVKLKVMRQGGITKTKFMFDLCESIGLECIIGHGFSTSLGALAEAHLAFTISSIKRACEFIGPLKLIRDISKRSIAPLMEKGFITRNEVNSLGNGLGITLEDILDINQLDTKDKSNQFVSDFH
ncbi:Arabinonate dehydratase [Metallosphaera sp. J1]|uniref:mandelate racemase/muconate lactonizing enzyme family protein n=1 Tax=Metallosphaera javensis (ex Hofmann et al. 2022) TaxID=99938 RepID=UPI001EDF9082|nr:mandelate racemase/muconate lactonizing enzyme family protein [Metallosphaera javensis (ex Hofmann et al. 2022)]MCG3109435.1 Arabinonate dehydratase [Metallosphaera javensis (ex Hofmann et al. 2022)]